jgi:hypothetical protein
VSNPLVADPHCVQVGAVVGPSVLEQGVSKPLVAGPHCVQKAAVVGISMLEQGVSEPLATGLHCVQEAAVVGLSMLEQGVSARAWPRATHPRQANVRQCRTRGGGGALAQRPPPWPQQTQNTYKKNMTKITEKSAKVIDERVSVHELRRCLVQIRGVLRPATC